MSSIAHGAECNTKLKKKNSKQENLGSCDRLHAYGEIGVPGKHISLESDYLVSKTFFSFFFFFKKRGVRRILDCINTQKRTPRSFTFCFSSGSCCSEIASGYTVCFACFSRPRLKTGTMLVINSHRHTTFRRNNTYAEDVTAGVSRPPAANRDPRRVTHLRPP